MTPTIGRVVLVQNLEPHINNGATEAPATITRVWGQAGPGLYTVNVKVQLDAHSDLWLTSLYLAVDEDGSAEVYRRSTVDRPVHAIWPPRV